MSTILEILQGRGFSICHICVQQVNAEHASPSEDGTNDGFVRPRFLASRRRPCRPLAPSAAPIPFSACGPAIVIVAAVPAGGVIAAIAAPPDPRRFVVNPPRDPIRVKMLRLTYRRRRYRCRRRFEAPPANRQLPQLAPLAFHYRM